MVIYTSKKLEKLRVAQKAMVRAMLGISLRDRVRNEEIGKLTRVEDVAFQKQSGNALGLWPETMKRKEQAS